MSGQAELELEDLIKTGVVSGLQDVHVSQPGTVLSYDAATQTAKIQPGIQRVLFNDDDERVAETIQPFENVPVIFLRTSSFSIHARLAPGDTVDLIFGSESMAEWRQGQTSIVQPGDLKRLGLTAPKAYPGLFPKTQPGPDTDDSLGTPGGLRIHFTSETVNVGTGAGFVAMANLVAIELNKIKALFAANAGAPQVYAVGDVSSSNLKAD